MRATEVKARRVPMANIWPVSEMRQERIRRCAISEPYLRILAYREQGIATANPLYPARSERYIHRSYVEVEYQMSERHACRLHVVAELTLDNRALKDVLSKNW
jgi:hypothetical protein